MALFVVHYITVPLSLNAHVVHTIKIEIEPVFAMVFDSSLRVGTLSDGLFKQLS